MPWKIPPVFENQHMLVRQTRRGGCFCLLGFPTGHEDFDRGGA